MNWWPLQTPSAEPAILTEGLAKRYGSSVAVRDLTLRVDRGTVFGFLGPNGAGKTTAVKMLVGLVRPSGGRAELFGKPVGDRATRARIGYLPELFRYQEWASASDVLRYHARLIGLDAQTMKNEIARTLDLASLSARTADRVGTFSKGMQQRLGLAVALLGAPELVFLDEPTSALDPIGRRDVREIIRHVRSQGTTVFLNSHLLTEVAEVCDRVAIVDRGAVVVAGTIDEVAGTAHAVRMRLVGNTMSIDAVLAPFGAIARDGDWTTVAGVAPERIPFVAEALVAAGIRIYHIEPKAASLEERFLASVGAKA